MQFYEVHKSLKLHLPGDLRLQTLVRSVIHERTLQFHLKIISGEIKFPKNVNKIYKSFRIVKKKL